MDRRRFLLTSLAGAVAAPFAAEGQAPGKVPRIGYVFVRSASDSQSVLDAAREGLREVKRRLPAMYGLREFPDARGLLSYGANVLDQYRRSAAFVDKILKGAKDRRSSLDRGGRCARAAPLGDARAGQVAPQMSARQRSSTYGTGKITAHGHRAHREHLR
jgi:hypothetical protein